MIKKAIQKNLILVAIWVSSILLLSQESFAQLTVKIQRFSDETEISANSEKIALGAKGSEQKVKYHWSLEGVGILDGNIERSTIFYIPPQSIDKDSIPATIRITVTNEKGEQAMDEITFAVVKGRIPPSIDPLIPGTLVTLSESFNSDDLSENWMVYENGQNTNISVYDGIITIMVNRRDNVWDGLYRPSWSIGNNQGAVILFRYKAGASVAIYLETGQWETNNYRRLGIGIAEDIKPSKIAWQGWQGKSGTGYFESTTLEKVLRPGQWYYLSITVNANGNLKAKIWEKENPNKQQEYEVKREWTGSLWRFCATVHAGILEIDESQEFTLK